MDDLNRPIVRTFKSLSYNDFIGIVNEGLNSGRIKKLGIIPLTNYSATTIITNTLSEMCKKKVPKSHYSEIEFDLEWEVKLNNKKEEILL